MKKFLLNVYLWPAFLILTLVCLLLLPLILLVNILLFRRPTSKVVRHGIRLYGWLTVRVLPFMAPAEIEDRSGGIGGPVIFTPNHCSAVDPYLFGLYQGETAFITSWPFRIPFFSWVMRVAEYINAEQGWDKIGRQGQRLLSGGCSLMVWPEGHRSSDGRLQRFKNGAFLLAVQTATPVVPVCIKGTGEFLPPGKNLFSPARVQLILLPKITPPTRGTEAEKVRMLKELVRQRIVEEICDW